MKIIIGSDKVGLSLKNVLYQHLKATGYNIIDIGIYTESQNQAYYDIAPLVAKAIQNGSYDKGILICGTGIGMSIVANKFKGIYAACVESSFTASMSVVINNVNIICMGHNVIGPKNAKDIVDRWLNTYFMENHEEKAHFLQNAIKEVKTIEANNFGSL